MYSVQCTCNFAQDINLGEQRRRDLVRYVIHLTDFYINHNSNLPSYEEANEFTLYWSDRAAFFVKCTKFNSAEASTQGPLEELKIDSQIMLVGFREAAI